LEQAEEPNMTERLAELLRNEPFIQFRIVLTSGSAYDVTSPLMVAVGQSELAYYFAKSDRLAHLRLNQLAALETLETQDA
jgi:hypothetical protein